MHFLFYLLIENALKLRDNFIYESQSFIKYLFYLTEEEPSIQCFIKSFKKLIKSKYDLLCYLLSNSFYIFRKMTEKELRLLGFDYFVVFRCN